MTCAEGDKLVQMSSQKILRNNVNILLEKCEKSCKSKQD